MFTVTSSRMRAQRATAPKPSTVAALAPMMMPDMIRNRNQRCVASGDKREKENHKIGTKGRRAETTDDLALQQSRGAAGELSIAQSRMVSLAGEAEHCTSR